MNDERLVLAFGFGEIVRAALWPGYEVEVVAAACGDDAALLGVATLAVVGRQPE